MSTVYSVKGFDAGAQIKDIDGRKGIVTGYFARFDNVDADGDIIRKGAFTKTILENGPASAQPRIKHLLNHSASQPLGVLTSLKEDTTGLQYESQTGKHSLGIDFVKMVESGLITEHSIGFQTIKKNQLQDYDGYKANPSKGWFELTEVRLWEGSSLTAWGANPNTPLTGMKGLSKEDQIKTLVNRQKQLDRFCRNSDATDETIELLLIEVKQLTQKIIDLSADTTQPGETIAPGGSNELLESLKQFRKSLKN